MSVDELLKQFLPRELRHDNKLGAIADGRRALEVKPVQPYSRTAMRQGSTKGGALAAAALILLFAVVGCASGSGGSAGGGGGGSSRDAAAQKLADYEGGIDSVSSLSAALDKLQPLCTESRTTIAGIVYATWSDLHKHGIDDSMLTTTHALARSIPASIAPTKCDQIAAAYLVLREQ